MLFNSFTYMLLFLPLVIFLYFTISKNLSFTWAKIFLVASSLFFYGWWKPVYLYLLGLSIITNYLMGTLIEWERRKSNRIYALVVGIVFNLSLLLYFKYANFFVDNINIVLGTHAILDKIILPLGISFFTFTQIAFLVDVSRGKANKVNFLNYCLFVSYFPHLLAGPIIHHANVMPQFEDKVNANIN